VVLRKPVITTYCYNTGSNCSGGTADSYWRVLQTIDPYSSTVTQTYPTGSSPATSSDSFTFNSGASIHSFAFTTDGYGRPIRTQTAQSPTGSDYDTNSVSYTWTGNYFTVNSSQPCSTTLGLDCSTVHAFEFDPLKRLYTESTTSNETITHTYTQNDDLAVLKPVPPGENSSGKQVQNEYDGLGRLTSSCQISSTASGNISCGQNTNTSAKGIVTTTSYSSAAGVTTVSSTRGAQTRSQTFDALGRVTQKTTPEGGTWTYYYDTVATGCSGLGVASAGNLTCTVDPNGNDTIYIYDSMNRVTDVGAGVGTTTTCKRFRYDNTQGVLGSRPTGITIANPYGKLVEAETDDCTWPITAAHQLTDEWFSYDKNGRVTDMWEWTLHSTQYYHSVTTYYEDGTPHTLQLASPSLQTMTYGLDGEGRWCSLTQGSTTNIVTGPCPQSGMYDAAGHVLNVQLTGSTPDQDIYTYDPNTGRMKTFEFEVGSSNLTGTLSWNPNGTLGQLQIVDGFNSGGSQTCYSNASGTVGYGYDDLGRLVEFDCGSGNWGQQFSYNDQYDNLTKTVISGRSGTTWNPGYSSSTNHVNGATYDSNGNMTNDGGSNVYGWNEFSQMKWTAASGTPTCGTTGQCATGYSD
jgi:YD repeat-containing protein